MQRRIVGLDLGVATDHTAVVLDESGKELARRRVQPRANHTKALAVVAAHLARRLWRTLERQSVYVVRDTDGNPVSRAEARHIITERWTVDEETRRRRRSKKRAGKVPQQVLKRHAQNGARSASTR